MLAAVTTQGGDPHISGHEPRAFPGLVHERQRRMSMGRRSHGTDDGQGTESEMSSSLHMEPGMAKMRLREDQEIAEGDDSD